MLTRITYRFDSQSALCLLIASLFGISACQRSSEVFERKALAPQDRAMLEPQLTFGTNYIIKKPAPPAIYQAGGIRLTDGYEWVQIHGYDKDAHLLIQALADIQPIEDFLAEASGQKPVTGTHTVVHQAAPIVNRPIVTRAELAGIVSAVEPLPATTITKERVLSDGTTQMVVYPQAQFQREQGIAP